jgi:Kdo2-lipid IVA lauroyltransferase/acyltransferase
MLKRLILFMIKMMSHVPIPVARFMGRAIGMISLLIPFKRKGIAFENIKTSLGESLGKRDLSRVNRKFLLHFSQMLFELPHIFRMDQDNLKEYVTFSNEETLIKAVSKGKGVFILTGHLGNWEILSAAASIRFGNTSVVARPFDNEELDDLMTSLRSRFGTEIITKQKAMRKLLNAIQRKRIIGILLDQNVDWYEGACVTFFNRWACTNKGLALLALRTGAPVIPAFALRRKDGRYRIIIGNEIPLIKTGDKTKDIEENTALYTQIIEDFIRKYPEQWFWFHNRWKTRPSCRLPEDFFNSAHP